MEYGFKCFYVKLKDNNKTVLNFVDFLTLCDSNCKYVVSSKYKNVVSVTYDKSQDEHDLKIKFDGLLNGVADILENCDGLEEWSEKERFWFENEGIRLCDIEKPSCIPNNYNPKLY
jgi:hypothetical protein